jgi:hypothetical protein
MPHMKGQFVMFETSVVCSLYTMPLPAVKNPHNSETRNIALHAITGVDFLV